MFLHVSHVSPYECTVYFRHTAAITFPIRDLFCAARFRLPCRVDIILERFLWQCLGGFQKNSKTVKSLLEIGRFSSPPLRLLPVG